MGAKNYFKNARVKELKVIEIKGIKIYLIHMYLPYSGKNVYYRFNDEEWNNKCTLERIQERKISSEKYLTTLYIYSNHIIK